MPAVGDEWRGGSAQTDRTGETNCLRQRVRYAAGLTQAERNNLDRQRKRAKLSDEFARIGDDRHPLRGRGDDLFAQQRAATALDQSELGIDSRPLRRPSDRVQECSSNVASGMPRLGSLNPVASEVADASNVKSRLAPAPRRDRRNDAPSCRCQGRASFRASRIQARARAASRFRRSLSATALMTHLALVRPSSPRVVVARSDRDLRADASEGKSYCLRSARRPTSARHPARPRMCASRFPAH